MAMEEEFADSKGKPQPTSTTVKIFLIPIFSVLLDPI